jgi:hypothetical protein
MEHLDTTLFPYHLQVFYFPIHTNFGKNHIHPDFHFWLQAELVESVELV